MYWKELRVWQKAHELVMEIYRTTNEFPKEERFGVVSQMRRAAVSVPANIVEGQARNTTKEYLSFLYNARGSLEETRYYLLLSKDLGYLRDKEYEQLEALCIIISRMLNKLIHSLKL